MLTPEVTYAGLLVVQTLHLLHHRLSKRHISFVEVAASVALLVPLQGFMPSTALMALHSALIAVQVAGSLWINKLSPRWGESA